VRKLFPRVALGGPLKEMTRGDLASAAGNGRPSCTIILPASSCFTRRSVSASSVSAADLVSGPPHVQRNDIFTHEIGIDDRPGRAGDRLTMTRTRHSFDPLGHRENGFLLLAQEPTRSAVTPWPCCRSVKSFAAPQVALPLPASLRGPRVQASG
jgi:hypothetical protein